MMLQGKHLNNLRFPRGNMVYLFGFLLLLWGGRNALQNQQDAWFWSETCTFALNKNKCFAFVTATRFQRGRTKGPDSGAMIGILLHEMLWKKMLILCLWKLQFYHLLVDGFSLVETAGELTWITRALPRILCHSYPSQAEACNSVLKWIVVLKMSLILNQIQDLHWRLNASSVCRSVVCSREDIHLV